jgi:hypothetical protein
MVRLAKSAPTAATSTTITTSNDSFLIQFDSMSGRVSKKVGQQVVAGFNVVT